MTSYLSSNVNKGSRAASYFTYLYDMIKELFTAKYSSDCHKLVENGFV